MFDHKGLAFGSDGASGLIQGKDGLRRLVVLDPGYGHPNAHHHSVNLGLFSELSMAGTDVLVLASRELTADSMNAATSGGGTVMPWFTIPRYPDDAETLAAPAYEGLAHAFSDQIVALFDQDIVQSDATILLHTGFAFHFYGLALALLKLNDRVRGHWIALTMFAPGAEAQPDDDELFLLENARVLLRYRMALKLLHRAAIRAGVKMLLASPTLGYQRTYQQLWPDRVGLHPAVNFQALAQDVVARRDDKCAVLLYLGCPKREKGMDFALALGIAAASRFPNVHLTFHFNAGFHGADCFVERVSKLRRAGQKFDNVSILNGNLSRADYDALLVKSDLVCLLYDPAHYRLKTSGIFWDVLRCEQVDWLVTQSSWMDRELVELGIAAETVEYGDVAGAMACIQRRMSNRTPPRTPATSANQEYRQQLCRSLGEWVLDALDSGNEGLLKRATTVKRLSQRVDGLP